MTILFFYFLKINLSIDHKRGVNFNYYVIFIFSLIKTVNLLMFTGILFILLTSTMPLENAFAIESIGDKTIIKIKKSLTTCTTQEGESCGIGKMQAKFRLLTTDDDEFSIGIAQGQMSIIFKSVKGITCILPDIDEQRCVVKLRNNDPLSFTYDKTNQLLEISGKFIDQNNNIYEFDAVGNITDSQNGKTTIDLNIKLSNSSLEVEREGGDDLFLTN